MYSTSELAALAVQKGGVAMTDPAKFEALKAQRLKENGAAYGQEVEARYGKAAKAAADAQYAGLTAAQFAAMTEAETQLKAALLSYLSAPLLPSAAAKQAFEAHRTWLDFDGDDTIKDVAMPPYMEQIVADGEDLYVLFESASAKYRKADLEFHADRVVKLDLGQLLHEQN